MYFPDRQARCMSTPLRTRDFSVRRSSSRR